MTWVIATTIQPPAALMMADVRMTVRSSSGGVTYHDVLRKIHPTSSRIIAGFAGHVRLGFSMIDCLRANFGHIPEGDRLMLGGYANRVSELLRERYLAEQGKHAADILVAGMFGDERTKTETAAAIRFDAPDFAPEIAKPGDAISIGSGNNRPDGDVRRWMGDKGYFDDDKSLTDFERRQGKVSVISAILGLRLRNKSSDSISVPQFQGVVDPYILQIEPYRFRFHDAEVEPEPARITSAAELNAYLKEQGLSASADVSATVLANALTGARSDRGSALRPTQGKLSAVTDT